MYQCIQVASYVSTRVLGEVSTNLHGVGEVQQNNDLIVRDVIDFKLRIKCQHTGLRRKTIFLYLTRITV